MLPLNPGPIIVLEAFPRTDTTMATNTAMATAAANNRLAALGQARNDKEKFVELFEAECAHWPLRQLETRLANFITEYCLAKSGLPAGSSETRCRDVALVRVVRQGNDKIASLLISQGADPTVHVPGETDSVLHIVARNRLESSFKLLIVNDGQGSVDVHAQDSKQRTAIFSAMEAGDDSWAMKVLSELKQKGADMAHRDVDKNNILHIIAEKNYIKSFRYLQQQTRSRLAAAQDRNGNGLTPSEVAHKHGHKELAALIRGP
ncbi:hypothetical protein F5Y17DRAFT_445451 [Xylariaceae sp. FL0594]|nr:hypothetical protein F5Y17DRAFT_445451 [Xylariaceae sp. FL0594]